MRNIANRESGILHSLTVNFTVFVYPPYCINYQSVDTIPAINLGNIEFLQKHFYNILTEKQAKITARIP